MGRVDGAVGPGCWLTGILRNPVEGRSAGDRIGDSVRQRVRWWTEHADAAEQLVIGGVNDMSGRYPLPASGLALRHGVVFNALVILLVAALDKGRR
jgi:hypothetical protein